MECGSRSCRVMLNYRLISVSVKTLYVFIRNHVESILLYNVFSLLCGQDPAGACAVSGYHRGRGTWFFQDRAHILVYMESYCTMLFVNCRH